MKAYIVNTGELHVDANLLHALSIQATRTNPNPSIEWRTIPSYAVVIEHPTEGWMLYDTGCSADSVKLWPPASANGCYWTPVEGATMCEQLALLGLTPADIRHVILSHFHMDHTGNIGLFAQTADVWVAQAEADFAFKQVMGSTDVSTHGAYCRSEVMAPFKTLHFVEEDGEILPGIQAYLLPGHTPGCLAVVADLNDKRVMIVGDALDTRHCYEGARPGSVWSTLDWAESLKKVKRIERELDVDDIWFGHDAEQFRAFGAIPELA